MRFLAASTDEWTRPAFNSRQPGGAAWTLTFQPGGPGAMAGRGKEMGYMVDMSGYLSRWKDVEAKFIRQVEGHPTFGDVRTKAMRIGDRMVLLAIEYPPGAGAPLHSYQHETVCYVVRGKVHVTVGDDVFVMEEGDACTHPSECPTASGASSMLWYLK